MIERFYTLPEFAEIVHASLRTARRWRTERRDPPSVKVGGRVLYRESDIQKWLDARAQLPLRAPPDIKRDQRGKWIASDKRKPFSRRRARANETVKAHAAETN